MEAGKEMEVNQKKWPIRNLARLMCQVSGFHLLNQMIDLRTND